MNDDTASRGFVPLASADPRGDRSDVAPVADRLGDAAVVGLGLATHGSHEWFGVCDRLTRALVADHGVRTVALETSLASFDAVVCLRETRPARPLV